jgi:PAS domain S-box-containing protein
MSESLDSIRVLHVDDDQNFADLTATYLEREDDRFSVEIETGASGGLDRLHNGNYDCIVSDFDIPGLNGIEFLERVREELPELPFILYTGKGSEEVASDAITAGATDYLQKGGGSDQYTVLANRIQNAVAQHRSQRLADEHQRITEVIRNLNRALVYAESVDEIEHDVCAILSDADPYLTACIAGVNTNTMQIKPRTWAGDDAGYFEALEMSVSEDTPGRHAPGGRAYHERDIAVSQSIPDDLEYEEWRDAATERGFQSLAVVPLEYDDDLYGLLALFADRRYAFDETEQDLLTELGDDIAHAMQARQVKSSLEKHGRVIDEAPVGISISAPDKPDNPLVYVNDGFAELAGYPEDEVLGENCRILQGPETTEQPVAEMREAIDNEERVTVELRNYRGDGEQFWNRVSIAPVYDDEGELSNYVGFQEDITDRKESVQKLRRSEERFEAMFNDPHILVGVLDIDGTVRDINDTAMDYIDASIEDVRGRKVWTAPWFSEELRPFIKENVEQAASGEYVTYEANLTTLDGGPYRMYGVIRPVTDDDGQIVSLIISARDVTEQEERERLLDVILENTTTPLFMKDRHGAYIFVNEGFRDLFDLHDVDIKGKTDADILPPEQADEIRTNDQLVLQDGESVDTEETIVTNGERRVYLSSKVPVYDLGTRSDPDEPVGVFGVATDITEQKRREEMLKQQNERFDELASVISHDLQTPLQTVQSRIELAQETGDISHLVAALDGLDRVNELREDIVELLRAREVVGELEPVDIGAIAESAWNVVNTPAEASFEVRESTHIQADTNAVSRLLENLVSNSVEHGNGGVSVWIGECDGGFYIADDGKGISPDIREDVFSPGFTTKSGGTGVGMTSVLQIVEGHGWEIEIADSENDGARFEVTDVEFTAE